MNPHRFLRFSRSLQDYRQALSYWRAPSTDFRSVDRPRYGKTESGATAECTEAYACWVARVGVFSEGYAVQPWRQNSAPTWAKYTAASNARNTQSESSMAESKTWVDKIATTVQVLSVVVGVVVSVLSFNATRQKEADARRIEALIHELQRSVYLETVKTAAIIANPDGRTADEISKAKRRFRELYVAELSMVESPDVESGMIGLAKAVDPELKQLSLAQQAALNLAHALGRSYQ